MASKKTTKTSVAEIPMWESGSIPSFRAHQDAMAAARGWVPTTIAAEVNGVWTEEHDADRRTGIPRYHTPGNEWVFIDADFAYRYEGTFAKRVDTMGRGRLEVTVYFMGDSFAPTKTGDRLTTLMEPLNDRDLTHTMGALRRSFNLSCLRDAERRADTYARSPEGKARGYEIDMRFDLEESRLAEIARERLCDRYGKHKAITAEGLKLHNLICAALDNDPDADVRDLERKRRILRRDWELARIEIRQLEALVTPTRALALADRDDSMESS
jgi:hypothetical protein